MRETSEVQKHECLQNEVSELCKVFATLSVEIQGLVLRWKKKEKKCGQRCHSSTQRIHRNFQFEYMVYMVRN